MQAAQVTHAALAFAREHPVSSECYLVLLEVPDELTLHWLLADADTNSLRAAAFHEPDLDHSLTAIALEGAAAQSCRRYHLLLRQVGGGESNDCNE